MLQFLMRRFISVSEEIKWQVFSAAKIIVNEDKLKCIAVFTALNPGEGKP